MKYIQPNPPSPNQSQSFTLANFVGGLNNRSQNVRINQSPNMLNMHFTEDGFIEKRKGTEYFDEVDLEEEVYFMDLFKPYSGYTSVLRASKTKLYENGVYIHTLKGPMMGANYMGNYFFTDTSGLYVYGKYNVTANTYVGVVGQPLDAYIVFKIVPPPADYTPLGETHVVGKTVYNFENRTIHYEPCLNEIKDTSKGAHYLPETPAYVIVRDGRLYVAGSRDSDDTVFISDISNGFYFPVLLSLQLPPTSDYIRGLCVYNDAVLVGRSEDIYVVRGLTNNVNINAQQFTLQQLTAHTGLANQRTFISAHNYTFFLGMDGQFYIVKSLDTSTDALATAVISRDIDIRVDPINVEYADITNASACFYDNSYYVAIGDKVLVYNYLLQAWTVWNNMNVSTFLRIQDKMYMGTRDGRTLQFSDRYMDLDKPYRAYWYSSYLDMGDASLFKFFKEFFVVARTFDTHKTDIRFVFEIDYSEVDAGIKIFNQISKWGVAKFGDTFINKNINSTTPLMIGHRGRVLRIYYENGYFETGRVKAKQNLPVFVIGQEAEGLYYVEDERKYYLFEEQGWVEQTSLELDQPMRVQQISGFYEMRGRRY